MASLALAVATAFAGVTDTSFVADNGDRTMRFETEIAAPAHDIWLALSTAEGWRRWAGKTAYVDFREGGAIETSYRPDAPRGDRDNIKNQIVAIVPDRLLVFRNVQAPTNFKDPELFARVTSILRIEPLGPRRSRVVYEGEGFGKGAGFDALYHQFAKGNAYTLSELRQAFPDAARRGGKRH